jgi:hypothetical protein
MECRNQHCTAYLIFFYLVTCLGCGSPVNGPTNMNQSEPLSAATESAEVATPESSAPVNSVQTAKQEVPSLSKSTTQIGSKVSKGSTIAKPTAEQLARWKFDAFDPLQLLAYRENDGTGFVSFVSVTNDAKQYVLGGARLTLWNIDDNELVHEFIEAKSRDQSLISFVYSPVGNWCAAGDASGLLRKFDIQGRTELASVSTDKNQMAAIAASLDGKEIATSSLTGDVMIWNAERLEKTSSFKVDTRGVKHLQYIAPQVLLAAGDTMSTWDTVTGTKIKSFASEKSQTAIGQSPDQQELIFGTKDALQRWDLASDKAIGEYAAVPSRDSAIRFSTDGKIVAVATGNAIHIVDATTGQKLQIIDANGSTISDLSWIPQTHLLLVGTDSGNIRIWGTPKEGQVIGLTPLHQPIVVTKRDASDPAPVAENLEVVDVRLLPKMPNAKPQTESFDTVTYAAPVSVDELKAFYRYTLEERGWRELSDQVTEYSTPFQKEGHTLTISPFGNKVTETLVSLRSAGNYDIRLTPRLVEFLTETTHDQKENVTYKVRASLLQIETELLRKLHAAGWTSVVRLIGRQNEEPNGRQLDFLKNGTRLRVLVQSDKDDAKLYVVSYSTSLSYHALPIPPDAGLVEWEEYFEAQLVANTSLSLKQATEFYEAAMKSQGWLPGEQGRTIEYDVVYLPYYWGQRDVTIALRPIANGLVRIRVGKYSDTSWQKPEDEVAKETNKEIASTPEEGIQAADLPILHAVGAPDYSEERGGNIKFEIEKKSLSDLSKEYVAAMSKLGWTSKPFGTPQEDSLNLHFEKGSTIIYYSSSIDPRGIRSVHFSGKGLLWTKTIASKQLISYSAWLRNNKFPASLKRLEEYQRQMERL